MVTFAQKQDEWYAEPSGIRLSSVANQLMSGKTSEELRIQYSFSESDWKLVADKLFELHCSDTGQFSEEVAKRCAEVGGSLSLYALAFPPYCTVAELDKIDALLKESPPDPKKLLDAVFPIVMHPRIRSLQLVGRFMKVPLFEEFGYYIDSAALAFYRGNTACSFMCLLPVVEGVLLRWQDFPARLSRKPTFRDTREFIRASLTRQPLPLLPYFVKGWINTIHKILDEHLYKHTEEGESFDGFNRHLALHMLEDKRFCSAENVMRTFLLLDLLSEIYICETRTQDPRWDTSHEEESTHIRAYSAALVSKIAPGQPERILEVYERHSP